jgi:hypothetical protein
MKIASAAEFVICNYAIIVTFRDADSWHVILMRRCEIASGDICLEPRKVTMNHNMEHDRGNLSEIG